MKENNLRISGETCRMSTQSECASDRGCWNSFIDKLDVDLRESKMYSWSSNAACNKISNASSIGVDFKEAIGSIIKVFEEKNLEIIDNKTLKNVEKHNFDPLFDLAFELYRENECVVLDKNLQIEYTIRLDSKFDGLIPVPIRFVLKSGSNIDMKIILKQNTSDQFYMCAFEFIMEESSNLNLSVLCCDGDLPISAVVSLQVFQKRSSIFNSHFDIRTSNFFKSNIIVNLEEKDASAKLLAKACAKQSGIIDNYTKIYHNAPSTFSKELYKHLLYDESTVVFNGSIYVKEDAQKIEAFQTNKSLILSDNATLHTKPQLEIFADDVKCSHGATVGKIDEDMLFYLKSRGLNEATAKNMIIEAFLEEVY